MRKKSGPLKQSTLHIIKGSDLSKFSWDRARQLVICCISTCEEIDDNGKARGKKEERKNKKEKKKRKERVKKPTSAGTGADFRVPWEWGLKTGCCSPTYATHRRRGKVKTSKMLPKKDKNKKDLTDRY